MATGQSMPGCLLESPKGKPVSICPVSWSPYSSTSMALMVRRCSDEMEDEKFAYKQMQRSVSGASTQLDDDAVLDRTVSIASTQLSESHEPDEPLQRTRRFVSAPALQSELGRWAAAQVCEEEGKAVHHPCPRKEYVLDNSQLRAATIGLAFRKTKNEFDVDRTISGPKWGTTIIGFDHGDDWVAVGKHFLPVFCGGARVLVESVEESRDGPALTEDGVVVDVGNGAPIFFSHDKHMAASFVMKNAMKEDVRFQRAVRLAHAACEAEHRILQQKACTLDLNGVARGFRPKPSPAKSCTVDRLKRFHRKRQARRRAAGGSGFPEACRLCVGEDGKVFAYLSVDDTRERRERIRRTRAHLRSQQEKIQRESVWLVLAVDQYGVIHE